MTELLVINSQLFHTFKITITKFPLPFIGPLPISHTTDYKFNR